jgi:acetoin:2,6-dichlorophenolindophenol oxidoreductase subunit alpha
VERYLTPINRELAEDIHKEILVTMYSVMVKIRKFEEKVAHLVSAGKIQTPCHLYIGQEAVATGACFALRQNDSVFSTHRCHGHYIAKGGNIKNLLAEIYCKATGCSKGRGGSMHVTAPEVGFLGSSAIVGGSIPLAVGTALASSIKGNGQVAVAFFGDGAVCEGVFYESLNFASLKKLPVIFICENNFYSTHMHISMVQADTDIHKKAELFSMPGLRIDGNNVIKVFMETKKAVERAQCGKGPTLIECLTYRWRGHVGPSWDLDKPIRPQEEVMWWLDKCPIKRLEEFLMQEGILSDQDKRNIHSEIDEETEEAVRFAEESPYPEAGGLLSKVFKE